ncbi:uncharacterized protein [Lepeophtheirus salmonis]|uniref:uncharacterized protein n=1 Tax=Lepeophtheirus salmonis TaxID=72036 RepID=UPI001AE6E5F7|nr:oocyte zinc finger protein XlCOF6-like [Lepeophtheirus salmonis]
MDLVPLIVPNKLSPYLGNSYILQCEMNEGLGSKVKSLKIKNELEDFENEENDEEFNEEIEDEGNGEDMNEDMGDDFNEDPLDIEDEGVYTCVKCSTTHESYDDFMVHLQFKCVKLKGGKNNRKRKKLQENIEDRTCKVCCKTFNSLKYLRYFHMTKCQGYNNIDPLNSTLLKCTNCNKEYKTPRHYYLHVKTCGTTETFSEKVDTRCLKDISCCKCGFIARSKEEFQSSNHKCEPDKPFKCTKCDFRTCHPDSLRKHDLAIHNKDKPTHCCEICGASYSYGAGLNRHLKTHSEKPPKLSCPTCGKLFSRRYTLNRHLESHKPAQKHPCETCGKIFVSLRYLKRHIKSQHPESGHLETHECTHCHSFFREKAYLKKHIRKKHSFN